MYALTNGLVLGTISVLACGYIIHDAPICRWGWSRSTGYVLYFRIVVVGLLLTLLLAALLHMPYLRGRTLFGLWLHPDHAPVLAFVGAVALRGFVEIMIWLYSKKYPKFRYKQDLKNLNDNGLNKIIYEKAHDEKMIMITLESNKVYAGLPIDAPGKEDNKWLRLVPLWSGYRDDQSTIHAQIDYSSVFDVPPTEREPMLLSVEKIVTVQPFDAKIFKEFNPKN